MPALLGGLMPIPLRIYDREPTGVGVMPDRPTDVVAPVSVAPRLAGIPPRVVRGASPATTRMSGAPGRPVRWCICATLGCLPAVGDLLPRSPPRRLCGRVQQPVQPR